MAEGLVTRGPDVSKWRPRALDLDNLDPIEYEYAIRGLDPDVQLFQGASEEKIQPNYSDFKRQQGESQ